MPGAAPIVPTYAELLEPVYAQLRQIANHDKLHLTSVAKIIEQSQDDKVKIIFGEVSQQLLGKMSPALLITQEHRVRIHGVPKPMKLKEHIILYVKQKNRAKTRFYIAHELGHILLHGPLFEDPNRRIPLPKKQAQALAQTVYGIRFDERHEMEADLFASILAEQRPAPRDRKPFGLPCLRILKRLASPQRGLAYSDLHRSLKPVPVSCRSCART